MRIDLYLVEKGYFESREKAKKAISDMRITVNGKTVLKSSLDVSDEDDIVIKDSEVNEYVGRGGLKLEAALDAFGISVKSLRAIDVGASTGGFTDCLLQRGVAKVYAVDIGHGQLHSSLLQNPKVINLEGVNARSLTCEIVENNPVDILVSDLSFISQKLVLPCFKNVLKVGGTLIILIKPQFEAGREHLNKNGIVKSEKVRLKVLEDIISFAENEGYSLIGSMKSPILGGSGNTEYLAAFIRK